MHPYHKATQVRNPAQQVPTVIAMDEISRARVGLWQLKEMEQDLCQKLSYVRMEIEVYKSRIEHLARVKVPINSLPFEILSYVLELVTLPTNHGDRSISPLVQVSRAWRNIILNSPKFWSNIHLDCYAKVPFVRACAARSRQHPLYIVIDFWQEGAQFSTLIDVIVPHVHRWRTLDISRLNGQCLQLVLDKLNPLKFPSLIRTAIITYTEMQFPTFLRSDNSPFLTSLRLSRVIPMEILPPGQRITDLSLKFSLHLFGPLTLPSLLASQYLTTLELEYSDCAPLRLNSIYLPFLTSLTLKARFPRELISAVIAPQLSYFSLTKIYNYSDSDPLSTVFHGCESKFNKVQHFCLHVEDGPTSAIECAESISSLFPRVHHVDLRAIHVDDFFRMNPDGWCPADYWQSIGSLAFRDITITDESPPEPFVRWLRHRNSAGLPMLHVKFIDCTFQSVDNRSEYSDPGSLSCFHDLLRGICILDIKDVALQATTTMYLTSASPPLLVCIAVIADSMALFTYLLRSSV